MLAFAPDEAGTKKITVSATTRIANLGTATVWIKSGNASVEATTSGLPIPAGVVEVLRFKMPADAPLNIAAIAAGTTGDITFTPGDGI